MKNTTFLTFALLFLLTFIPFSAEAYTCGNGHIETGEVCDNGTSNSATQPNACRPDCRAAWCGDGVKDSGEQCDEGGANSDQNPNKCRENCTPPRCGDRVTDNNAPYGEQCDDGNASNEDGCLNECKACVMLGAIGNIEITDDTELCAGTIKLDDYGDYGTVIIKRSDVTLDCNGAKIAGEGRGVGVMIFRSHNVTIKNCEIYGYETGIMGEDSNNVTLVNNILCGNSVADINLPGATQMTGNANKCKKPGNWNDSGQQGCTQTVPVCNMPVLQMDQSSLGGPAAAKALKNMPHVTAQPKTALKPLTGGAVLQRVEPESEEKAVTPSSKKLVPFRQTVPIVPKK